MSLLAPLRNQDFRHIWLANMGSNFGSLIQTVGAAWLMTVISQSVTMVSLVNAMAALPVVFLSLISGTLTDRRNPRTVMLWSQISMAAASLILTVITLVGLIDPWTLLFLTFVIGCGAAINVPAWQASLPDFVGRQNLADAVSLNSIGFNLTRCVAPATGGLIVLLTGSTAAFFVNALTFFPLIVVLLRWHPKPRSSAPSTNSFIGDMAKGFQYAVSSRAVSRVILRTLTFGGSTIGIQALLPIVARDLLAGGPLELGILLGGYGVGAVAMGLCNHLLRRALSYETQAKVGFAGFATSAVVVALSPHLWLSTVACALAGAFWLSTLALFNSSVQLSTKRSMLARALSLYQTALYGGMALGGAAWGAIAEAVGVAAALQCSAIAMLIGLGVGMVPGLALVAPDENDAP